MKAAQINKYGSAEVLEINDAVAEPVVAAGMVLVSVHAAGVNPVDWKIRQGYLASMVPLQFPVTLGGDFSGVILEVGDGVQTFAKGDKVYGSASVMAGGSGSFAEKALAGAGVIAPAPASMTDAEAAALPLVGASAYQALVDTMKLAAGQKILIHGGTGGIGMVAIQIAKNLGAYVATTVSASGVDTAKILGADEVIDYTSQQFEATIRDYDAVFDLVGGDTCKKSYAVLKKGGILVSMVEQPDKALMEQYGVTAIAQFTKTTTERLLHVAKLAESGVIKIHIDKVFDLGHASEALQYLETGHPKGKVVVTALEAV